GTNYNNTNGTVSDSIGKLTITSSVAAGDKVYDGTTAASTTCSLTGVLVADTANVTCAASSSTFADKNMGTAKAVTANVITLSGGASGNYQLPTMTATTTANITPKPASVTPNTASKIYG